MVGWGGCGGDCVGIFIQGFCLSEGHSVVPAVWSYIFRISM
jgi:hypothetical protein